MESIKVKLLNIKLEDFDYEEMKLENNKFSVQELINLIDEYEKGNLRDENIDAKVFYILSYYILKEGRNGFVNIEEGNKKSRYKYFYKSCRICVELCLKHNDFTNSNNILASYLDNLETGKKGLWYYRTSIDLYSRRFKTFYLCYPEKLLNKINEFTYRLKGKENESEKKKFQMTIRQVIDRFFDDYINDKYYVSYNSITKFINYFIDNKVEIDPEFNRGISEFKKYILDNNTPEDFIWTPNGDKVCYDDDDEDEDEDYQAGYITIEEEFKHDIDENSFLQTDGILEKGTVAILGDCVLKKDSIKGIAKNLGILNLEYISYDKLPNINIKSKFSWSTKYYGVIICAVPHSVKGKGDFNSIVELFKNEPGMPFSYVMYEDGALKASKTKFREAFGKIINEVKKYQKI